MWSIKMKDGQWFSVFARGRENLIQRKAVATNAKKGKKKATAFAVASSVPSRT